MAVSLLRTRIEYFGRRPPGSGTSPSLRARVPNRMPLRRRPSLFYFCIERVSVSAKRIARMARGHFASTVRASPQSGPAPQQLRALVRLLDLRGSRSE
jgi:hypothetical protein